MSKLTGISTLISFLAAVVGGVCYFAFNHLITVICGVITLVDSIIQVIYGDQNNLSTEIFTIIVGAVIAAIFKLPFISTIALALCISLILFTGLGYISIIFSFISFCFKKK